MHENGNISNDNNDPILGQPIEEGDEDRCRAMWLARIYQFVIDARSNDPRYQRERIKARAWLKGVEDSDFAFTCEMAEVEFKVIRKRVLILMDDPTLPIDFRVLKKLHKTRAGDGVETRHRYFSRCRKNALAREVARTGQDNAPAEESGKKRNKAA